MERFPNFAICWKTHKKQQQKKKKKEKKKLHINYDLSLRSLDNLVFVPFKTGELVKGFLLAAYHHPIVS